MPKFECIVEAMATVEAIIEVEAENEEEAKQKAESFAELQLASWDMIEPPKEYDVNFVTVEQLDGFDEEEDK